MLYLIAQTLFSFNKRRKCANVAIYTKYTYLSYYIVGD